MWQTLLVALMSAIKFEYAAQRKLRERNKFWYRVAHWPLWIFVFFLAPGPLTFQLFATGPSQGNMTWLAIVMVLTGIAGRFGQLPGCEAKPYILRFDEDRPNPYYRRICYSFAWGAAITFASLNLAGLVVAVFTGKWVLKQIYDFGYLPVYGTVVLLGLIGFMPRVKRSTRGEGHERRYFYGTVWAVTVAQTVLLVLWKALPKNPTTDIVKLVVYVTVLAVMGWCAHLGLLHRTRPILPGEDMVAD